MITQIEFIILVFTHIGFAGLGILVGIQIMKYHYHRKYRKDENGNFKRK
jgi:hypothetical protein